MFEVFAFNFYSQLFISFCSAEIAFIIVITMKIIIIIIEGVPLIALMLAHFCVIP